MMAHRIRTALLIVLSATSCAHRIVQPGEPGTRSRTITPNEAVDLSKVHFTAGDVKFMQDMIHHHAQALDMTALIASRTSIEKMKLLGQRIEISQSDEIKMMQRWLEVRGQQAPDIHAHHAPSATLMPGMLTPEEMDRLAAASGSEIHWALVEGIVPQQDGGVDIVD